jgi:hypothetical protein
LEFLRVPYLIFHVVFEQRYQGAAVFALDAPIVGLRHLLTSLGMAWYNNPPMLPKKSSEVNLDELTIGDRVLVNLHHRRFEQAIIRAITPIAGGAKYQVDFGQNETATIREWQIVEKL